MNMATTGLCSMAVVLLAAAGAARSADPALVLQAAHAEMVTALSIDPLGRWMASGGADGAIGVWDLNTGLRVADFRGPATAVAALHLDPYQGVGLTATYGGASTALTWRVDQPRPVAPQVHDLRALRFTSSMDASGDGSAPTSFAVSGIDGFQVWTTATAARPLRYRGAGSLFDDIAVGPGGRHIATLSQSGVLTLWTRRRGGRAGYTGRKLDTAKHATRRMAFDARGRLLVASRPDIGSRAVPPSSRPQLQLDLWDPLRGTRVSAFTLRNRCTLMPLAFSGAGHIAVGIGSTFLASNAGTVAHADPDPDCRSTRLGLVVLEPRPRLVPTTLAADGVTVAAFNASGTVLGIGLADGGVGTVAIPAVPEGRLELVMRPLGAGELQPVAGLAVINGGRALAVAGGKRVTTWDLTTGHPKYVVTTGSELTALAGRPELDRFAVAEDGGQVAILDGGAGQPLFRHNFGGSDLRLAMSKDGDRLAVGRASYTPELGEKALSVVHFGNPQDLGKYSLRDLPDVTQGVISLALSEDGRTLATGHMRLDGPQAPRSTLKLLDLATGRERPSVFSASRQAVRGLAFQPGGGLLGIATALPLFDQTRSFLLWDSVTGHLQPTEEDGNLNNSVALSPDGSLAAVGTVYADGPALTLWDAGRGQRLAQLPGHSAAVGTLVFHGNEQLLSGARDGTVRIWPVSKRAGIIAPEATLVNFGGEGGWLIAAADGRFDTDDLDRLNALAWVFPDDPLRAFPAEIFTRALYSPGLFGRLLGCGGKPGCDPLPVRQDGIDMLNRVQPRVAIGAVRPGAAADEVLVEVTVGGAVDPTQRNGKIRTDAYDLRLFRDGRLVGQLPQPGSGAGRPGDDRAWRSASLVKDGTHVFKVRLARGAAAGRVAFAAYAFNEDRVKSGTARLAYERTAVPAAPPRPRAYIVSVGVNAFDDTSLDLNYAAKDARDMGAALTGLLSRLQAYEVVGLQLLSERARGPARELRQATRANVSNVMQLLAGGPETARAALLRVPGIDRTAVGRLARATPDDLVILTFSSHGYADSEGQFYLLPSDTGARGPGQSFPPGRLMSSADLSDWLRPIDAGQMALIIDACHSAASVDTPGFRPGPLGDAGLGQLAYDKGILILAATQAPDAALEAGKLEQGLLTYALVGTGLAPDLADPARLGADMNRDGQLTLREWLRYGVAQVPRLYAGIRTNTLPLVQRDPLVDQREWLERIAAAGQTPALFDFQKPVIDVYLQREAR